MAKKENKKSKWLKKYLAGFIKRTNTFKKGKREKEILEDMRKSLRYRMRPTFPSELIKPRNEEHRKKLNKQMEALGITVLV